MRLSDIIRGLKSVFERKKNNPIQLGNDGNLESNPKPLKVAKKNTPIHISEDTVNIDGTLKVNGVDVSTEPDTGATELNELSDVTYSSGDLTIDSLDKIIADDFVVDSGAGITLDSHSGDFIAKVAGIEFSATNSAFAGMILGYTCVGADVSDTLYALTTSYVCFDDSGGTPIKVRFKTPPSEYVEIEVELYFSSGSSNKQLRLSLSDNATYGSNTLAHPDQFEKTVITPSRGWGGTVTQKWLLGDGNLETIGSFNDIWIAASTDSTSGLPAIKWGGNASNEYTNLVLKAIALPHSIIEGS